ncbi:MAG TPA: UvrD-helicase domain-containing protein [Gemmatimonadales bacterium]|nr:UvrD-helicase domain-containing protein [Gemmatimonadales bacterium]
MPFTPLPQQLRAIDAPLGPVLVVAGPGAGKTFCLTSRIQHLVDKGFDPHRICAVTFTNRAAEEIASRLKHDVRRGTIHAFCLALLREFPDHAGLQKGFGVADEQYQDVILHRLRIPAERRGGMLNRFGRHRLQQYELTPDEARLYREYAAWLEHRNMVDFDDLIVKAEGLLRTNGELADTIAARWDYLLVDEFQDVNAVQYDLLKRLAAPHGNFFVVGDDEQSIFAWTGADPYVLERFRRDYDVEPIILDKNCRCSRQIFETARRVLAQNPRLFQKQLTADTESAHEVGVQAFRDEHDEATWLIADLRTDPDPHAAILYRKHRVGEYLEGRLLRAGIPCRLARGRALIEDAVIGYVIAALRIVRMPDDAGALHAFAKIVLSEHFLQEVEAALEDAEPFLTSMRRLAARRPREDPDTKKLWRLIYQVENLRALPRAHPTLPAVIEEILSQTVGPYRNKLEERHDELTDPATWPELQVDSVTIPPGVMLLRARMEGRDPLRVFKALQLLHARDLDTTLPRYVTFDFETTDNDVETCGVVEIGAARVVNGAIVDRFHTLVNPYRAISARATEVHGYTDADVAGAPAFHEVFPQFRAFVGDDVLIAHNGQRFDIPVLRRLAKDQPGVETLTFYDTLLLARSLSQGSASQEDIAHRLGIDCGRAHHALDDAVTLAHVYRELEKQRTARARKAVRADLLDYLAVALALEEGARSKEQTTLFEIGRYRALGPYSDALEFYVATRTPEMPTLDQIIERLGGHKLMARLRAQRDPTQRYASAVARLRALVDEKASLADSIDALLERVALSASDDNGPAQSRINLLTLHSTKGLEFTRVYVVGVEDNEILGYQPTQDEIEEARRLLYVGMTRARDRLTLTRAARRFGRDTGGSTFLEEMGLLTRDQLGDENVALPVLNVKE